MKLPIWPESISIVTSTRSSRSGVIISVPHVVGQVEQRRRLIEIKVRGLKGLHRTADPRFHGSNGPRDRTARSYRTDHADRNGPGEDRGARTGHLEAAATHVAVPSPVRSPPPSAARNDAPLAARRAELRDRQVATAVRGGRPASGGDRAAQPPPALRHRHLPGRGRSPTAPARSAHGAGRASSCCPTLPYGTETNQMRFPLAMNLNPSDPRAGDHRPGRLAGNARHPQVRPPERPRRQ